MNTWAVQARKQAQLLAAWELDLLALLVTAKSNQEIATTLAISEEIIEKHLHSLFLKFDASSPVEVAVYAV